MVLPTPGYPTKRTISGSAFGGEGEEEGLDFPFDLGLRAEEGIRAVDVGVKGGTVIVNSGYMGEKM